MNRLSDSGWREPTNTESATETNPRAQALALGVVLSIHATHNVDLCLHCDHTQTGIRSPTLLPVLEHPPGDVSDSRVSPIPAPLHSHPRSDLKSRRLTPQDRLIPLLHHTSAACGTQPWLPRRERPPPSLRWTLLARRTNLDEPEYDHLGVLRPG